jgi:hypothetical protein
MNEAERQPSAAAESRSAAEAVGSQMQGVVRLLSHDLNAALAQAVLVPNLIRVTAPSGGLTMESRMDHAGQAPYSISSKCNA